MKVDQEAFKKFIKGELKEHVVEKRIVKDLPRGKLVRTELETSSGKLLFYQEEKSLMNSSGQQIRTIKTSQRCACGNPMSVEDIRSGNVKACWNCGKMICPKCWREWKGIRLCEKCMVELSEFKSPRDVIRRKEWERKKEIEAKKIEKLERLCMKDKSFCLKEGLKLGYELAEYGLWLPHKETFEIKKVTNNELTIQYVPSNGEEWVQTFSVSKDQIPFSLPTPIWLPPKLLGKSIPSRRMIPWTLRSEAHGMIKAGLLKTGILEPDALELLSRSSFEFIGRQRVNIYSYLGGFFWGDSYFKYNDCWVLSARSKYIDLELFYNTVTNLLMQERVKIRYERLGKDVLNLSKTLYAINLFDLI